MKYARFGSFVLFLIVATLTCFGQQKIALQSLIPPAPNAAELGKYGTYPVGELTGTPDISFPLYEIVSGDLKLPIVLSYHASGIRVSQKSTDVGLGWSIMAGGTISRTVYGTPDNNGFGLFNYAPPSFETLFNMNNYYTMQTYTNSGYDLEPDLFVYNVGGKSGKFIYSPNTQNFVTIPFEPIKITKSGQGQTVLFKIVDEKGIIYEFEQYASTTLSSTASNGPSWTTINSWYLTAMISPDNSDIITFEYELVQIADEIDQQVYPIGKVYSNGNDVFASGDPFSSTITTLKSTSTYNERLLKKITFNNGYVEFNRNTPRKDAFPITNMLDEITVFNKDDVPVRKISFEHDYFLSTPFLDNWAYHRLKLNGFSVAGLNSNDKQEHNFYYNTTALPKYGSYGIDYWGFSNGTNNVSLIPLTTVKASEINSVTFANGETYSNGFINPDESWTVGSGSRESSAEHMQAYVLNKIEYPTGGYSTFAYEPHKYQSDELVKISIPNSATTTGITKFQKSQKVIPLSVLSDPANSLDGPYVSAKFTINFSASNMGNVDLEDFTQRVTLRNTTNNTNLKTWNHSGDLTIPLTVVEYINLFPGISYELKHEVFGQPNVFISTDVNWTENTSQHAIKIGGGLRIAGIDHYAKDGDLARKERFEYGQDGDGLGVKLFDEENFYRNYEDVATAYFSPSTSPEGTGGICNLKSTLWQRHFLGISKYNPISYQGSPILYDKVTHYLGDSQSNSGKTEYHYAINSDNPAFPDEFINSGNYGSINSAWNVAELTDEISFKRVGNLYSRVSHVHNDYAVYNRLTLTGILLKKHRQYVVQGSCGTDPSGPQPSNIRYGQGFYTMYRYDIKTGINKLAKTTSTTFDDNEAPLVSRIEEFAYENATNRFLTASFTQNSDGTITALKSKYPHDFSDPVSLKMIDKNIINVPLEEKVFLLKGGSEKLISTLSTTYYEIGNLIAKEKIFASLGANLPEPRILFNRYDTYGNITEQQKKSNSKESFIWGYNGEYPIAKVINASVDEIAYTSFESDAAGSWLIPSNNRSSSSSLTGTKSYDLSGGAIQKIGLSPNQEYVVSLWGKGGTSILVNGQNVSSQRRSGDWSYFEITVSGSSTISVSGSGVIDDLRLFPKGSQMTSFTYDPLVGMSSATDNNNVTVYYQYDDLNRLEAVKDRNKNILSAYKYHYKSNE